MLDLWESPHWVLVSFLFVCCLFIYFYFFMVPLFRHIVGSHIPSSDIAHARCLSVAGIHPSTA